MLGGSPEARGHGGSLDSNGGHHDRKNGGYHYHRGLHTKGSPSRRKKDNGVMGTACTLAVSAMVGLLWSGSRKSR
jgi:hypothetical protein